MFISEGTATGVAPIIVDEHGKNSIIVILGANLLLSSEDIQKCEGLIKGSKVLVTNLEIPFETAFSSLKLAKSNLGLLATHFPSNFSTIFSLINLFLIIILDNSKNHIEFCTSI